MLSFLKSEHAKLRDAAKNWLYLAGKVYHFRKDRLSDHELQRLLQLSETVKVESKSRKGDSTRLRLAIEALKDHMEQVGGNYYPRGGMAENVEFFFAAIIIYLGFTTFFIKPFKIPTNSMWPTYYGMTGEVYPDQAEAPKALEKAFRLVAFGAKSYDIKAPADGEVLVPVARTSSGAQPWSDRVTVKRYFLINTPGLRYSLRVGDERVSFKFPADFKLEDEVIEPLEAAGFETPYSRVRGAYLKPEQIADVETVEVRRSSAPGDVAKLQIAWVRTGLHVKKGETILNFDLMTGDQLFVDRMSYHFAAPELGDGFVFKTDQIPALNDDKFFIKRLCGLPGDAVRIEGGRIFVNDEPATGSEAFELNANKVEPYSGYAAIRMENGAGRETNRQIMEVPPRMFLALGDNSHNSLDGRYWGYVPEDSVIGKPIMIYYPFTKRFGLAK